MQSPLAVVWTILIIFILIRFRSIDGKNLKRRHIWPPGIIGWSFRDPFKLIKSQEKRNAVRAILRSSFAAWEEALGGYLLFIEKPARKFEKSGEKPRRLDIDIYFARGEHGCREAMDGPGGIIAHSKLPPNGILHLDADEKWSVDGKKGLDLRYALLHEVGHLLGLRHSVRRESIMNAEYRRTSADPQLSQFDRRAIFKLYQLHKYL